MKPLPSLVRGLDPTKLQYSETEPLKFQAIQWTPVDEGTLPAIGSRGEDERQFVVYINGVNTNGNSVTLKTFFNPFFFVRVPDNCDVDQFVREALLENRGQDRYFYLHRKFIGKQSYGCRVRVRSSYVGSETLWWTDCFVAHFTGLIPKRRKFIKITFKTRDLVRKAVKHLRQCYPSYHIYEANLEPHLRLAQFANTEMAGWIEVDRSKFHYVFDGSPNRCSDSQIEAHLPDWRGMRGFDCLKNAPMVHWSIDLECRSPVSGMFPDPRMPGAEIIQIGIYITLQDQKKEVKLLINSGPCAPLGPDEHLIVAENERELIWQFIHRLKQSDPDTVHAYNGYGFDFEYLAIRAKMVGLWEDFKSLGKITKHDLTVYEKKLKSNAFGTNLWTLLNMPGRFVFDTMAKMKRDHKLPSYALNYTSRKFLSNKLARNPLSCTKGSPLMTIKQKTHGFKIGQWINLADVSTPDRVKTEGFYAYRCGGWTFEQLHGCLHKITKIVSPDSFVVEMPTPASKTVEDGMGGGNVKVFESKLDVDFDAMNKAFDNKDARVMAQVGRYCIQDAVLPQKMLDKQSVIPNCIEMSKVTWVPLEYLITRGEQIKVFTKFCTLAWKQERAVPALARRNTDDPSNEVHRKYEGGLVLHPYVDFYTEPIAVPDFKSLYPSVICDNRLCYCNLVSDPQYLNLPGVNYLYVKINEEITHIFATNNVGIVPAVTANLLDARIKRKDDMKNAATPEEYAIHNGAQLALKVTANSIYGITGVHPDMALLPCLPIAESTTKLGRDLTSFTELYANDSRNFAFVMACTTHFPIYYAHHCLFPNGRKGLMTTKALLSCKDISQIQVWGTDGFASVKQITKKDGTLVHKSDLVTITGPKTRNGPDITVTKSIAEMKDWDMASCDELFGVELTKGRPYDFQNYACKVIYGDTDSVFTKFNVDHLSDPLHQQIYSMVVAAYIAFDITHQIRLNNPHVPYEDQRMELEYEKVYKRLILYSKKRYGGIMFELDPERESHDSKGTMGKRRDFCTFAKEIFGKLDESLFNPEKTDKNELVGDAIGVAKLGSEDLLNGLVPLEKLAVSKSLKGEYKVREKKESTNKRMRTFGSDTIFEGDLVRLKKDGKDAKPWKVLKRDKTDIIGSVRLEKVIDGQVSKNRVRYTDITSRAGYMMEFEKIVDPATPEEEVAGITQSHVHMARKQHKRDPASAPRVGSRTQMIFEESDDPNVLQKDRAEDLTYAKNHNLKPDRLYYLQKQCKNSWSQTLDTVVPGTSQKLFDDAIARFTARKNGQVCIKEYFKHEGLPQEISLGLDRKVLKKRNHRRKRKDVPSQSILSMFAGIEAKKSRNDQN